MKCSIIVFHLLNGGKKQKKKQIPLEEKAPCNKRFSLFSFANVTLKTAKYVENQKETQRGKKQKIKSK